MRAIWITRITEFIFCFGVIGWTLENLNPWDITYCLINTIAFLMLFDVCRNIRVEKEKGLVQDGRKNKGV